MLAAVKQGLERGAQEEVTVTKQSKAMLPSIAFEGRGI